MERDEAVDKIQAACKEIALQFMKIHPSVSRLSDDATQGDILKSLHGMTVELEVIKKKLIQLQNRDDSTEL